MVSENCRKGLARSADSGISPIVFAAPLSAGILQMRRSAAKPHALELPETRNTQEVFGAIVVRSGEILNTGLFGEEPSTVEPAPTALELDGFPLSRPVAAAAAAFSSSRRLLVHTIV